MQLLRPLAIAALSFNVLLLIAQDVAITPKWQKGDTRTLFMTKVESEQKADGSTEEHTERLDAKVRVTNMTATTYMVELEYRNVVITQLQELGGTVGAELDPWRRMVLRYEVDRRSGDALLYNWQDVRDVVNGSFNEIKRSMRKKDPEMADELLPVLEVITQMFQSREAIDGYFRGPIEMLTFCLGKPLTLGETLTLTSAEASPCGDGKDTLKVETMIRLEALNSEAQQCTISASQNWDMAPVVAMMKEVHTALINAGGAEKASQARSKAEMEKALAEITMEMKDEQTIVMDLESTWPLRAERTSTVVSKSPEGTRTHTVRMNAEVR